MAIVVYVKTGRTGGTANDLDGIDGNSLNDGDIGLVYESDGLRVYRNNASGAASEDDPLVIVPDANPGNNNWELKTAIGKSQQKFDEVTISSGSITLTGPGNYSVDTEGDAAEDDLSSVAGLDEGEKAILKPESDSRTVNIINNTNIRLQGIDFIMDSQYDTVELQGIGGGVVRECSRAKCGPI